MRKRSDNQLDLEQGAARTIEHAREELDCSRSSVYELVRAGRLETPAHHHAEHSQARRLAEHLSDSARRFVARRRAVTKGDA